MASLRSIGEYVGSWLKQRIESVRLAHEAAKRANQLGEEISREYAPVKTGAAINSEAIQYDWWPIDENGIRFWVFRDAAKVNGVRINVTAAEAQAIADEIGALLTTPKIEDLVYKHATIKVNPFPSNPATTTAAQHSAKIDKAVGSGIGLVATIGKSWVLTDKLSSKVAANYGWHTTGSASEASATIPGVNVWQGVGHKHNPYHRDYSQTLRLVARKVIIDGEVWDLELALKDPSVASRFNHTGALKVTRQPYSDKPAVTLPASELERPYWQDGISHAEARQALVAAFTKVFGRKPTMREAQFAQAVSLGESNYGQAAFTNRLTGEKIRSTWNMGAVQCAAKPPCPDGCFEATDTRENGEPYQACFRRYASPIEGFENFLRVLYIGGKGRFNRAAVLAAAEKGDIRNFSTVMRASGYFELGLEKHIAGMKKNLGIITKALGEPMPEASSGAGGIALIGLGIGLAAIAAMKG